MSKEDKIKAIRIELWDGKKFLIPKILIKKIVIPGVVINKKYKRLVIEYPVVSDTRK